VTRRFFIKNMALKNVQLEIPRHGYRRLMPFNRFFVERVDTIVILHFGLLNNSGLLLDRYSAAISQRELDGQKPSLMEYLGKLGSLGEAPPAWQPPAGPSSIELFNFVLVSSNSEVAELGLNNVVVRAVNDLRQTTGGKVPAEPIALLRCTQETMKHLIRELYPLP
jgi:hypothetical protein